MKKIVVALAATLLLVTLGAPGTAGAQEYRRTTAEVLQVNRGAEALTVRAVIDGKTTDAILSVRSSIAHVLDTLRPGDKVVVTYIRINDQLRAEQIVKAAP